LRILLWKFINAFNKRQFPRLCCFLLEHTCIILHESKGPCIVPYFFRTCCPQVRVMMKITNRKIHRSHRRKMQHTAVMWAKEEGWKGEGDEWKGVVLFLLTLLTWQ
jgi:hypothetical protein